MSPWLVPTVISADPSASTLSSRGMQRRSDPGAARTVLAAPGSPRRKRLAMTNTVEASYGWCCTNGRCFDRSGRGGLCGAKRRLAPSATTQCCETAYDAPLIRPTGLAGESGLGRWRLASEPIPAGCGPVLRVFCAPRQSTCRPLPRMLPHVRKPRLLPMSPRPQRLTLIELSTRRPLPSPHTADKVDPLCRMSLQLCW